MSRRHKLDVSPVPEKVFYINETGFADITAYDAIDYNKYRTEEDWQTREFSQEDNVRIYIPLDLNKSAILRRLWRIGCRLGDPTECDEFAWSNWKNGKKTAAPSVFHMMRLMSWRTHI